MGVRVLPGLPREEEMKIWGLFRRAKERVMPMKKERIDCSTCELYSTHKKLGCWELTRPYSEGKYIRKMKTRGWCAALNMSVAEMAVEIHPAATGSWDCIYWKSKKRGESRKASLTMLA